MGRRATYIYVENWPALPSEQLTTHTDQGLPTNDHLHHLHRRCMHQ